MPKYKVTDPTSGKTLTLIGDSPPSEQELESIFSSYSPKEVSSSNGRQDLLSIADEQFRSGHPFKAALSALGAYGQRAEGVIAGPALAAQEGRFGDMGKAALSALKGESQPELGDVFRGAGVPEPLAAAGGLVSSALLDPLGMATKTVGTARKVLLKGSQKAAAATGTKAVDVAMSLQGQPKNVKEFMLADKFKAMDKKYLSNHAVTEPADKLVDTVQKELYKPANSKYDKVVVNAPSIPIKNTEELALKLESLRDSAVASDEEISKISRVIDRVRGSGSKASNVEEASSLVDEFGRPLPSTITKSGIDKEPTVQNILRIQRSLRKSARKSVLDADAARIIGDHLTPQYKPLEKANLLWAKYTDGLKLQTKLVGKLEERAGKKVASNRGELLDYFSDRSNNVKGRLDALQGLVKTDITTDAKRVAAAHNFKKALPMSGGTFSAPAFGASAGYTIGGLPGSVAGGALGILASSPRGVGTLARQGFKRGGKELTPRAKALQRIIGSTVDQGILRQVTGRND